MRLRRLELFIIGLTLAFAFFMGGFFTGRSWSAVNITSVSTQNKGTQEINVDPQQTIRRAASDNDSENQVIQPADPGPENNTSINDTAPVRPTQTEQPDGTPKTGDGKININLASQSELTDLPGIGAVLASRIIDHRKQHGDFTKIEDIRNVSGIGEKRYEAIQDKITIG